VLILDEDRVEGGMLAFHLRREGVVVMLMTSVEEATDAIAWSAPDVVLVEVTGRGFDGHEFLAQLATQPLDVFAVADRPLELADELEVLRLGVIDVLMKPLDPVTLSRRLANRPVRELRGSVADLPEGGISGDLVVHSATHLLQMAHRHRMNARLHVEIDGDWAVLLVRHGEIIDAEAPSATGREAAYQTIRAQQGAFVLFPLEADAEELSRDDVVRADLATLVADALGRQEPKAVNPGKSQSNETFVLPHVGSPRGPMARLGGDETLEYIAQGANNPKPNSARVKRPGEKARAERAKSADARPANPRQPIGTDTFRAAPSGVQPARPSLVPKGDSGDVTEARTIVPVEAMRRAMDAARAKAASASQGLKATLDEGFDETTDQGSRDANRRFKNGDVAERRPGTDPMGRLLNVQDEGVPAAERIPRSRDTIIQTPSSRQLKRVGGPRTGESERANRKKTDPELKAVRAEAVAPEFEPPVASARPAQVSEPARARRPRRSARGNAASPMTWALSLVLVALAVFIVFRLTNREVVTPVADDYETRLGRALLDLDAGKRDAARSELATLVVASEAPSGAISMLARLHYEDGRLPEAQALLERLGERHPRDAEVFAWLGLVQLERDQVAEARASFEKAQKAAPSGSLSRQLDALLKAGVPANGADGTVPTSGQRPTP
jgi:CheY-like chemotaxis protein